MTVFKSLRLFQGEDRENGLLPDNEDYFASVYPEAVVLVVEDSEINQTVIEGILEMFGIVPTFAYNGVDCIEYLKISKFDLIFMDIHMPVMDGYKATYAIRNSNEEYSDVPIVAMTANATNEEIDQYHQVGMNDYVGKPIDIRLVSTILNKYLSSFKVGKTVRGISDKNGHFEEYKMKSPYSHRLEISGVDITEGINRFGGKRDAYYRSLSNFASELIIDIKNFEDFIAPGKAKERVKFLHTLKGVSGNLSIKNIYNLTVLVERNFLDGTLDEMTFSQWVEECNQVTKDILSVLPTTHLNVVYRNGSHEEFTYCVTVLKAALERSSATECDKILEEMKVTSWENVPFEYLEELYKKIEDYEYESALKLLTEL